MTGCFLNCSVDLKDEICIMRCERKYEFSMVADDMFDLSMDGYAPSTKKSWASKLKRIKTFFKNSDVREITLSDILRYIKQHKELSNKTLNEDLTLLRKIFNLACGDYLISHSPMEGISTLIVAPSTCQPFTLAELSTLKAAQASCQSIKNGFLLATLTGLRLSEWLALTASDYDPKNKLLRIERACVLSQFKRTKNNGSERFVELPLTAIEIIEHQLTLTQNLPEQSISIFERDYKSRTRLICRPLFPNLRTGQFYSRDKAVSKSFRCWLKGVGVELRGINQARHTYASHAVIAGVNLNWLAIQLGHKGLGMIYKHYSRWIKEDATSYCELLESHFRKPR